MTAQDVDVGVPPLATLPIVAYLIHANLIAQPLHRQLKTLIKRVHTHV